MGFLITNKMEIWKTIEGFENYQVSNFGRVKSLKRAKEKILTNTLNGRGYYGVSLLKNKKLATKTIHQLVSIAFLNHTRCGLSLVVNHKDFNKLNNHVDNLEIVTQRENTNKKHLNTSSQYTGVCWNKSNNKWRAQIKIKGRLKHLGYFIYELQASSAYQLALSKL